MIKLLMSSAGRRVELINCFREAAKELNIDIKIISIDTDPSWSPACQMSDFYYKVPSCYDFSFMDEVVEICIKHKINVIIPTIDPELIFYSEFKQRFKDIGTEVIVSSPNVIAITRDKGKTANFLKNKGITTPKTWEIENFFKTFSSTDLPVILKPKDGSGSKGVVYIESIHCLENLKIDRSKYIAQKACKGKEYTINAYYTGSGRCVACIPHFRKFVRDGEVCLAQTIRINEFRDIAQRFSEIFKGIRGNICFQGFKEPDGNTVIFEINARFGGGYPICNHAGGTFARWILEELIGTEPSYNDEWKEGVRMMRYDAAVFSLFQ